MTVRVEHEQFGHFVEEGKVPATNAQIWARIGARLNYAVPVDFPQATKLKLLTCTARTNCVSRDARHSNSPFPMRDILSNIGVPRASLVGAVTDTAIVFACSSDARPRVLKV